MKNLIPYFIEQKHLNGETHGYLAAYTMFVDLSGFTAITEALMREGSSGAERLSDILNEIFTPLVNLVYGRKGFIPYFAGDAFTAIFPEENLENPEEIIETALLACELFSHRKFEFEQFTIGIKVGAAYGQVEWGITGDQQKAFYFKGDPIDHCAYGQNEADDQEVIIDEALQARLSSARFTFERITYPYLKLTREDVNLPEIPTKVDLPDLNRDVALQFYPANILDSNQQGEFRTVISVFISFSGIDSHELLDEFSKIVLEQSSSFSGYFKEIDFGDKGGVMVVFFGAPVSFENNVERALEFVLALREEVAPLQKRSTLQFKAGITIGTAFTGIVGGNERCQYACVGNRVNLAARLMSSAGWGEMLVDKEIQHNRLFIFTHKGDVKYRGIEGDVPTFKLLGHSADEWPDYESKFVGREQEFSQLMEFSKPLYNGESPGLAYIFGEAGMGKSRLMYEFKNKLTEGGKMQWYSCQSDQILRKPFNPFVYFLKNYFDQSPDASSADKRGSFESRLEQLEEKLEQNPKDDGAILKELRRTSSVLAAQLGIHYSGSLWEQLDALGRYQNTIAAITNLLIAESISTPLVVELEDGHWTDENSTELLRELIRQMRKYPIFLIVTSRFNDDGTTSYVVNKNAVLVNNLGYLELQLKALSTRAVRAFAEASLGGKIKREFLDLLIRTSNNNPFYLEQILEYFTESDLLERKEGEWTIQDENIKLSNSINAILTARIDRLSDLVKETVKAAAVIGREFEIPVLSEVMKVQDEFIRRNGDSNILLNQQVKSAERVQIWRAMNELRYIFRHSLLREAVYGMQLNTRLKHLHKLIAQAIEKIFEEEIEERFADLAFHYEQAEELDKTREYLLKAGDRARANYQNSQAIEYYSKLVNLLDPKKFPEQISRLHIRIGKIQQLIGQWPESEQSFNDAFKLANKAGDKVLSGRVLNNIGRVMTLKGQYAEAMERLQVAAGLFETARDDIGIAKVYGNIGDLYFRQGNYEEAKAYFEQSIKINRKLDSTGGMARIVSNLGLTHMNRGNYDEGIDVQLKQLEIAENKGDKPGMAVLYTNTGIVFLEKGDYDSALDTFEKGLALSEELGNKLLTSIAIGCIGSVYQGKGDYARAMEHFELDLKLCEELGDKQGTAIALGLIGEQLSIEGQFHKAIEYLQKNLMLCEQLGYQKGIAKAVNTLGDIFYHTKQYSRSLEFYNRAIEVTRKINNKLVLGYSLVEKAAVLIELNNLTELKVTAEEAMTIAEKEANPDLNFAAQILHSKVLYLQSEPERARKVILNLLEKKLSKQQKADAFFELYLQDGTNRDARNQALTLYRELYATTPKYLFKHRIKMIEG
ncbi:MAG: adenylate/guanylate cyclase domain-containing protein [Bacteroidetes bacterium]|nr:MAG: adenylate/guanylate cyclase domain-containing protein [Bacteroidota bacterium]